MTFTPRESRDRHSDLPIFAWRPRCEIAAFPAEKRHGHIRTVASALLLRKGKAAASYWRLTADKLVKQMRSASLPEPIIRREVRAFFEAVQYEMVRLASNGQGDAA